MAKKKKKSVHQLVILLSVVIGVLAVVAISLGVALIGVSKQQAAAVESSQPVNVNIGIMQYDIKEGKAVVVDDPGIENLKEFLTNAAKKDVALGCESSYYEVKLTTKDRTQVLLDYGCERLGSSMYAVRTGDSWKTISPTSQFDMLGNPLCGYVDEYQISTEIAPVCYTVGDTEDSVRYFGR